MAHAFRKHSKHHLDFSRDISNHRNTTWRANMVTWMIEAGDIYFKIPGLAFWYFLKLFYFFYPPLKRTLQSSIAKGEQILSNVKSEVCFVKSKAPCSICFHALTIRVYFKFDCADNHIYFPALFSAFEIKARSRGINLNMVRPVKD